MAQNQMSLMPPEILLGILSGMDALSRINVTTAHPEIFLRPNFNVFQQDAFMFNQQGQGGNPVQSTGLVGTDRPLLYAAINNFVSIAVIREILMVSMSVNPSSIDGIWGADIYQLPLHEAIEAGNPQVVSLLLEFGANPSVFYDNTFFGAQFSQCSVAAPHVQCKPQSPPGIPPFNSNKTNCLTPILGALFTRGANDGTSERRQAVEECALLLYANGARIPHRAQLAMLQVLDEDLQQQLHFPLGVRFCRLVQAILEPLIPLRRGEPVFDTVIYHALHHASRSQRSDDDRDLIDYLAGIGIPFLGTPLAGVSTGRLRFSQTCANEAFKKNHLRTAAFLLDKYTDQQSPLDYDYINLSLMGFAEDNGGLLLFVQAFYRAASVGDCAHEGISVSREYLHELLLTELIPISFGESAGDAIRWLLAQGIVGTPQHVHRAIIARNPVVLRALFQSGISTDQGLDAYSVSPLEFCLDPLRLNEVYVLLSAGANPGLVSAGARENLLLQFRIRFAETYTQSSQRITQAMRQPEYFATDRPERERAMFHYILG